MEFQHKISDRLSREHQEAILLLERLEKFLRLFGIDQQPDWTSHEVRTLMSDLKFALEREIPGHFAVEEAELFPLLSELGRGQMVEILREDHKIILQLVSQVKPIVVKTLSAPSSITKEEWAVLYAKGGALVTELSTHAQKEEFGFVPAVDELINDDLAEAIFKRYPAF